MACRCPCLFWLTFTFYSPILSLLSTTVFLKSGNRNNISRFSFFVRKRYNFFLVPTDTYASSSARGTPPTEIAWIRVQPTGSASNFPSAANFSTPMLRQENSTRLITRQLPAPLQHTSAAHPHDWYGERCPEPPFLSLDSNVEEPHNGGDGKSFSLLGSGISKSNTFWRVWRESDFPEASPF